MYLSPFRKQFGDYDFSLISDTIKEYYHVDRGKRFTSDTIASSPGFRKISKIVNAEFANDKAYREKWGKLTSHLKKVFKRPVHGFPDLGGGGFLAEVVIKEDKRPDFIRQKNLRFYVSIIGPFFSIHGIDTSIAILPIESGVPDFDKGNFEATHAITISPVFEYQEVFNTLERELRAFFPGHLFVPYEVGMSTMKNISIADELRDLRSMDTVYEALFGLRSVHNCPTRGDERYGMSDWIKPLSDKERSLIDLVSQHVIAAPDDTTVHKVWKLKGSKRLETFKVGGNLMFAMDLFDVIDLTDKSKFIMMSKERGTPSSGKYKIRNDIIEVNPNCSFRIAEVSADRLTLNLVLDFQDQNASIKGEALEMKFVQMKKLTGFKS